MYRRFDVIIATIVRREVAYQQNTSLKSKDRPIREKCSTKNSGRKNHGSATSAFPNLFTPTNRKFFQKYFEGWLIKWNLYHVLSAFKCSYYEWSIYSPQKCLKLLGEKPLKCSECFPFKLSVKILLREVERNHSCELSVIIHNVIISYI